MNARLSMLQLAKVLWPKSRFYEQQREIIESVERDNETFVVAGNMLGKDFVAGFICVAFFLTRHPCRIITTSTKDDHLDVLWGEIGRFIMESKYPLEHRQGGPLIVNHHEIKKIVNGQTCPLSYVKGMVANEQTIESFQGHHLDRSDGRPHCLFVGDEASSLRQSLWEMVSTWTHRKLVIGNPWQCENFFKWAMKGQPGTDDKGGDIPAPNNQHYLRRVIQIKAVDSPNVRYGIAQEKIGKEPKIILPGVLPYDEYLLRRQLWDKVRQCVSLDGEFYEGAEILLFPPDWINRAEELAETLPRVRKGEAMGIDPAEGGDKTAWAVVDRQGLIHLQSMQTPDTELIPRHTLALMKQYQIPPERVMIDRGGGGYPLACRLRGMGYEVKTVAFGESVIPPRRQGTSSLSRKVEADERRYAYRLRRDQMYGLLSELLDPVNEGFGLPRFYTELRRQLAPIPKVYDKEGRLTLPPKHKQPNQRTDTQTLTDLIGHSPDEADALVLAVYGMELDRLSPRPRIGVLF